MSEKKGIICCVSNSKFDRMFMWGNVIRGTATYYKFITPPGSPTVCKGLNSVAAFTCGDYLYVKLLSPDTKPRPHWYKSTHCIRVDMTDSLFHLFATFTENESIYQLKDYL